MNIVPLTAASINENMLQGFHYNQLITKKWTYINNKWEITDAIIKREWSEEKRRWIPQYLNRQTERGGVVVATFEAEHLIGFASLDGYLRGETAKYANLTMLFVDDRWKRQGIGKMLFLEICKYAEKMNADKLFISAIPSVETLDFYFNIGCKDAEEIITEYIDTEQDRYLEFSLKNTQ